MWKRWTKDNPLGLNESLLAMRAYAPYHHLYAVSLCFCVSNKIPEGVPNPVVAFDTATGAAKVDQIVDMAGSCLNTALELAQTSHSRGTGSSAHKTGLRPRLVLPGYGPR